MSWLVKLGLVNKISKSITVSVGTESYTENIGQAFVITAQGLTALRRAKGASRHNRISKTICYEMLATKGTDREFLRKRRSLIIKLLSESKDPISGDNIVAYLEGHNIATTNRVVSDDIQGFVNIGLTIDKTGDTYRWRDKINDFVIPVRAGIDQSTFEHAKDALRERITHIPHHYLSLLDLAYDSTQNRLFEMKALELLTEECGFGGRHLGGSRKPDGIIYTETLSENFGVIIDTKAYSGGYNLPISQADEMQRYIEENQRRDVHENPNKWWEHFRDDVRRFYFMFVSGHFTGRYQEQIDRVARITKTKGTAIEIYSLLLLADRIKSSAYNLSQVESMIFSE